MACALYCGLLAATVVLSAATLLLLLTLLLLHLFANGAAAIGVVCACATALLVVRAPPKTVPRLSLRRVVCDVAAPVAVIVAFCDNDSAARRQWHDSDIEERRAQQSRAEGRRLRSGTTVQRGASEREGRQTRRATTTNTANTAHAQRGARKQHRADARGRDGG